MTIKYFGGKSAHYNKIKHLIPQYTKLVSPFFGAGGIELRLDPIGHIEVFNDIDSNLHNFYAVLQNPSLFNEFIKLVELTPFSEQFFNDSKAYFELPFEYFGTNVQRAHLFFIRNRLSLGGDGKKFALTTSRLRRNIGENISSFLNSVDGLYDLHTRLKFAEFRNMDFRDFISKYDAENAFLICDPTYMEETRVGGGYEHEMTDQDHIDLLNILSDCKSKFLLHGYESDLYKSYEKENGWRRFEYQMSSSASFGSEKKKKSEIIWMNYSLDT